MEYYPKLVWFFQASKSSNCTENHPDFVQKHDNNLHPVMVAGCGNDVSICGPINFNMDIE